MEAQANFSLEILLYNTENMNYLTDIYMVISIAQETKNNVFMSQHKGNKFANIKF